MDRPWERAPTGVRSDPTSALRRSRAVPGATTATWAARAEGVDPLRIEELRLQTGAGPMVLRFEPRMTVLGPLDVAEREALVDTLLAAAAGTEPGVALRYIDRTGRQVLTGPDGPRFLDDRRPAEVVNGPGSGRPDEDGPLLNVRSGDLRLSAEDNEPTVDDRVAMAEARSKCDLLRNLLRSTTDTNEKADRIHAELLDLDRRAAEPIDRAGHLVGLLARRRVALERRLAEAETTDVTALRRQLSALTAQVAAHERRVAATTTPSPAELSRDLMDLIGRHARHGDDDFLPLLVNEPLSRVPADQRTAMLEMLLRLSTRVQIIYLTEDAVVRSWARSHDAGMGISVLEPV
jgi:hypothetical protein